MIHISFSRYGSTEAFLADIKWILHNCIIFNSTASKLTSVAKTLVKVISIYLIYTEPTFTSKIQFSILEIIMIVEFCRFASMKCKRLKTAQTVT